MAAVDDAPPSAFYHARSSEAVAPVRRMNLLLLPNGRGLLTKGRTRGVGGMTSLLTSPLRRVVAVAALLSAPAAFAQVPDLTPSSFAVVAQPGGEAAQLTGPLRTLLKFDVRPMMAVTLSEAVPAGISAQFGAKDEFPFDTRLQLYGWPERPGLYCDLLRSRRLASSAACLRDTDLDGRFDEGLRLDFNSARSNVLLISHSGKIIGARFNPKPIPLPNPIAYSPSRPAVTARLALSWRPGRKAAGAPTVELLISTHGFTGCRKRCDLSPRQHPARRRAVRDQGEDPRFDPEGAMRYRILGMTDGAAVPLVFHGFTVRIIGY